MSENLSPALDVLYCAEDEMGDGTRRTLDILSVDAPIRPILLSKNRHLGPDRYDGLLETSSALLESHRVQRSVTDWPFEHFWGNPYEPKLTLSFWDISLTLTKSMEAEPICCGN